MKQTTIVCRPRMAVEHIGITISGPTDYSTAIRLQIDAGIYLSLPLDAADAEAVGMALIEAARDAKTQGAPRTPPPTPLYHEPEAIEEPNHA